MQNVYLTQYQLAKITNDLRNCLSEDLIENMPEKISDVVDKKIKVLINDIERPMLMTEAADYAGVKRDTFKHTVARVDKKRRTKEELIYDKNGKRVFYKWEVDAYYLGKQTRKE